MICPHCNSKKVQSRGTRIRNSGIKVREFSCKECKKWFTVHLNPPQVQEAADEPVGIAGRVGKRNQAKRLMAMNITSGGVNSFVEDKGIKDAASTEPEKPSSTPLRYDVYIDKPIESLVEKTTVELSPSAQKRDAASEH